MEPTINKDLIQFQKAAFNNAFTAMSMFQDQAESATRMMLEMGVLPDEGKRLINDWIQAFKKGRECFKRALEETYTSIEEVSAKSKAGRA